jgi:hypothetical protein
MKLSRFSLYILPMVWIALGVRPPQPFSKAHIAMDIEGHFPDFEWPEGEEVWWHEPLYFLGEGRQCAVFASQKGDVVVKFFFTKRPRPKWRWRPFSIKQILPFMAQAKQKRRAAQHLKRARQVMQNYAESYLGLREETGLLAIHLAATHGDLPECRLIDTLGKSHQVSLDRASFIVQKRCQPLDARKAAELSQEIALLLQRKKELGFRDRRAGFKYENYGILEKRVIMLDPGNLYHLAIEKMPAADRRSDR